MPACDPDLAASTIILSAQSIRDPPCQRQTQAHTARNAVRRRFHLREELEDVLLGERVEGFAADTGNDDTQQEVSGIGIEMFVARNKVQPFLSCYHGHCFFRCVEIITGFPR